MDRFLSNTPFSWATGYRTDCRKMLRYMQEYISEF